MTLDIPKPLYKLILVVVFGLAIGAGFQASARHLWADDLRIIGAEDHGGQMQIVRDENTRLRSQVVDMKERIAIFEAK